MDKLGFYMMFGAFLLGAMERHLDRRGRNDPDGDHSPSLVASLGGVFALVVGASVFAGGAVAEHSTFKTLAALGTVGLLALTLNTLAGGAEIYPKLPGRVMEKLEKHEWALRRYVFPMSYALAALGLAYEALLTFVLK